MKKFFIYLSLIFVLLTAFDIRGAATAQEVLDKAVNKLKSSKGIYADFTLKQGGKQVNGKYKASGEKFCIITPSNCAWYDGKSLVTLNKHDNEATITNPSSDELRATDPLRYLSSRSDFTATFDKSSGPSRKVIVLSPKKRGTNVKQIQLVLSGASLTPVKIGIVTSDGKSVNLTLSNVNYSAIIKSNEFNFSKSSHPGVKIIDLR